MPSSLGAKTSGAVHHTIVSELAHHNGLFLLFENGVKKNNMLTDLPAYNQLIAHQEKIANAHMRDWFREDPLRAQRFSTSAAGCFIDYSKNRITDETLQLLMALAEQCQLESERERMFRGEIMNHSEHQPVLHTALRKPRKESLLVNGVDVVARAHSTLDKIETFVNALHRQQQLGFTGKAITDVVNIGIGGSHLGSALVVDALQSFRYPKLSVHFIANIDGNEIDDVLTQVDLETTAFIVSSKSFGTLETLCNAKTVLACYPDQAAALKHHFFAVTANADAARTFGIQTDAIFPIWDWVGGRFSLWSAIGLPIAISIGMKGFRELLAGAHAMDNHFANTALVDNAPVILALLSIWYSNFFHYSTHAIFPYYRRLRLFPAYMKQLEMESNGKSITRRAKAINYDTGVISWGEVGCNGQHSFHQLLHQGTRVVPGDFIIPLQAEHEHQRHHQLLYANCLSQSQALMQGKSEQEMLEVAMSRGYDRERAHQFAKIAATPGNKPSNTILLPALTPNALGALLALYEHKTFVQSVIWDINAFDQFGVELGKYMASHITGLLERDQSRNGLDCSTENLLRKMLKA